MDAKSATASEKPLCTANTRARKLLLEGLSALKARRGLLAWTPPPVASLVQAVPGIDIVRLIGRGSMGAVYEARQVSLDRRVAVKILPEDLALDEGFVSRFRLEGRLLARLQHPQIVTVLDSGESRDGHPFLLMEFIDGESLNQRLERGRVDADEALELLLKVAGAVAAAHERGIAHRDLKPANILLTRSGQVKVADFGLADLFNAEDADPGLDSAGRPLGSGGGGTPGYSAPEQLLNSTDSGPRADVFSLGVIGRELLTGRHPDRLLPASRLSEVPSRLAAPLRRALSVHPPRRHADAREFLSAILNARDAILKAQRQGHELRRRRAAAASFARHLDRFSDAVAELYAPPDPSGFPLRIVSAMERLLGSDSVCYNEFGPGHFVAVESPKGLTAPHLDAFNAHVADHPSIAYVQRTGSTEAVRISDFLSHRAWRDTGLYQECFGKAGLRHQLAGMFPAGPIQVGFSLNRSGTDFREDDRTLLTRLARHMPKAWRNANTLTHIGQRNNSSLGLTAVAVDARGNIVDETPAVREYLLKYFEIAGSRLPDEVRRWLCSQQESRGGENPSAAVDFVIQQPADRLTVRFCAPTAGGGAYLIFEESPERITEQGEARRLV